MIAIVGDVTIPDCPVAIAGIGSLARIPGAGIFIVPPTPTTNVSATACGTELLICIIITSVLTHPPPSVTLYSKLSFKGSEPVTKGGAVYSAIPAVETVMEPTVGGVINSKVKTGSIPNIYSSSRTPSVRSLVLTSPSFTFKASPSTIGQSFIGFTHISTCPVAVKPSWSVIVYENESLPDGISSPLC